jgi:branched-chain amino acid transport system ATP-binding protein
VSLQTVPVLQLDGLSAGYDAAAVVRELDLYFGAGEVVALLGPNGAGKTTTLRAISGLVRPMAGMIRLGGADIAGRSPTARARLGIAHVPEGRGVFFGMTVGEHFRIGYRGERLDADVAFGYFPALAKLVDRRVGLLSGGEQQMLSLARALGRRPEVLLADELSLGLAPMVVERLLTSVRQAADERGVAVLIVEQHVRQALSVADRVYVMERGRVSLSGAVADVRAKIEQIEVAYLSAAAPAAGQEDT